MTKKQLALFNFIKEYSDKNGVSPTFEEMREAMGLKYTNSISQMIKSMEKKGVIERQIGFNRSVKIISN